MKESISYSFLLNIIILFIFVCAAIITGIFSYYRAFKANTIITNEIEKYEGFNCLSEESIKKKLNSVSYNVPFEVECKSSFGEPCMTDDEKKYAVVSYNLDFSSIYYMGEEYSESKNQHYSAMNSNYSCYDVEVKDDETGEVIEKKHDNTNCVNTKKYQYGVYTYMYVDLPIISNLLKIPIYTKTKIMYEFRNIYLAGNNSGKSYDSRFLPDEWLDVNLPNVFFSHYLNEEYTKKLAGLNENVNGIRFYDSYNSRDSFKNNAIPGNIVASGYNLECGYKIDYSKY